MSARTNVEACVFSDYRFEQAAQALNTSHFDIIGRMTAVWSHCTARNTYFITESIFTAITRLPSLFNVALEVGLLRKERNKIYVAGTRTRIEWLERLKTNSKRGGEANKNNRQSKPKVKYSQKASQAASQIASPLTPAPAPTPSLSKESNHELFLKTKEHLGKSGCSQSEMMDGLAKAEEWIRQTGCTPEEADKVIDLVIRTSRDENGKPIRKPFRYLSKNNTFSEKLKLYRMKSTQRAEQDAQANAKGVEEKPETEDEFRNLAMVQNLVVDFTKTHSLQSS